jgi:hypothetical protein
MVSAEKTGMTGLITIWMLPKKLHFAKNKASYTTR